MLLLVQSVIINSKLQSLSFNLLYNRSITSNTKLLKLGLYRSVSCTRVKRLFKKNWSELFMNHQIDLSCIIPFIIVIIDSIAAGLAHFSVVWHNFFRNALNLCIGGYRAKHVIWRVDKLSFPASMTLYTVVPITSNSIIQLILPMVFYAFIIKFTLNYPMRRLLLLFFSPEATNFHIFIKYLMRLILS